MAATYDPFSKLIAGVRPLGLRPNATTSDQEKSLLSRIGGTALGGLEAVGSVLDLPGSTVRDVIGGITTGDWSRYNPVDQWAPWNWFSSENRVAGRDLNRELGLAGPEDTTGNWWGGLGTEILTDPLSWFAPFGLTKAGVTASKAGTATRGIANAMRAGERAGAVFHLPFSTKPLAAIGTGPAAEKVAGLLDTGIDAVKYSTPMRLVRSQFSAPLRGTTTTEVQKLAENLAPDLERARAGGREIVARSGQLLHEAGATPADADAVRRAFEAVTPRAGDMAVPAAAVDPVAAELQRSIQARANLGFAVHPFSDIETAAGRLRYSPRHAAGEFGTGVDALLGVKRGREWTVKTAEDLGRKWYLRDIRGGTTTIKDVVRDPGVDAIIRVLENGTITRKQAYDAIEQWIGTTYGASIPQFATRTTRAGTVQANRWRAMARKIVAMPEDVRKAGLFANDPLVDASIGIMHGRDTEQVGEGILEFLAKDAASWETNATDGIRVRDIAKALGFDSKQGSQFWNQMAARGGAVTPDTLMRRDVALDLLKFRDSFQDPKAVGEILKAVDKLTNFTKGMYTGVWPAFHTRNAISGFFQNILTGTMGPAEAVARTVDAYNLIRGQTVKGAASIPAVAQRLAAQGRALTDEEGTKVLREMAAAHELAGKYEHAGASVVGNIAGKRPGVLQDIVQSIPGLEPVSWRTTLQRAAGATPDTTPLKFWRQRGVIEEGTKKFGLAAAGEDLGYVIESVNRIAPFIAQLRSGVDDTVAAMKIGASQAKYANRHFTPLELEKMQRLFPFYKFCVDSSHEILTRRGWKRYTELVIGEEVLTFNQETETLQWEPLLNVHVFNHNGPINQYEQSRKGKKIRFRFTDGHRWPVKQPACVLSSGRAQRAYRYIRLGSELRLNDCFYRSGEFHGRDTILSPRHAALLGWIVTDGHFRWKRVKGANYAEAVIYQSPKKHLDEVVALTGSSRRAPHPDTGVVAVNVKSIDLAVITEHFKSRSDLPRIACHLSRESAEAMYDAMIKAEGTIYDSGRTMFYQYEQNEVLEAFQILCQLTGRSANYCQQGCTVSRPKFYYNVGTRISQVDYSGKVWCPETPSGTWVMRSDGNVVITGNSSQMMPWFLKTLVTEPGGRLAQTIRAVSGARQPSDIVPDYVAETTSIPATGALESILGKPPKGTDRYISGLGMMYEDPLGFFGSGIRGLGLETISRMNPLVKFPLEWSFGESTFQKGPMGGRELLDQDPLIGRILANVKENATGEKTKHAPKVGGGFTEAMAANSPISRILSSIRVATDPRKNLASKAAVLGTGIRIADVSEGAKESKIRELADPMMRELGAKAFTRTYFPADVVASMSPQERAAAMQYQALMNALAKRQKERVANAKRTS